MANTNRISLRKENERIISVMGGKDRKQEKQRHLEVEGKGGEFPLYIFRPLDTRSPAEKEVLRLEKWEGFNILEEWQRESAGGKYKSKQQ